MGEIREDLINGLKHMADDHPCCKGTIELAIKELSLLPDIDMIEHVGKCECQQKTAWLAGVPHCPNCQGTGETTRPATLEDIVSVVMSMFYLGHFRDINVEFGNDSGGILRIKEGEG
jgi:hypothetical protein